MRLYSVLLFALVTLLFFSCDNSQSGEQTSASKPKEIVTDPLLIEIESMEAKAKTDTVLDRTTALRLLQAYQTYYNKHGKDSLALHYLFEGARVADALGKYQKSADMLLSYHDLITNNDKKAEAAFLAAFIYDAHLKDSKQAMELYNKVIELYPQSQWAEQAKSALHLVDKSDEDLIKFLDEKNKKAS